MRCFYRKPDVLELCWKKFLHPWQKKFQNNLIIPTIGIGAGNDCDGQVLVMHDMLGINTEFKPRFLRTYLNLHEQITGAVHQYIKDIKAKDFPNEKEQY